MSRVKYSGEQSKKKLILNDDYLQMENQPFEDEANATAAAQMVP